MDDRVATILRLGISVALLTFIVNSVGVDKLVTNLSNVRPSFLLIATTLAVFNVALSAYKWKLLLLIKQIDLSFRVLFVYYYIGQFFNAFLPTMVGGDGVRAYYLQQNHGAGPDAVSSVFVERLTGLLTVLAIGGTATLFVSNRIPTVVVVAILLVCIPGATVLVALLFTDFGRDMFERTLFRVELFDVGDRLASVYDAVYEYRTARHMLVPVIGLSLLFRLVLIFNNYVVAVGLGMELPLVYFLVFIPLVEVLLFLPVSIQGFGVREMSYVYLFGSVGAATGTALTLALVMQLILGVLNNLIGGIVYVGKDDYSL